MAYVAAVSATLVSFCVSCLDVEQRPAVMDEPVVVLNSELTRVTERQQLALHNYAAFRTGSDTSTDLLTQESVGRRCATC